MPYQQRPLILPNSPGIPDILWVDEVIHQKACLFWQNLPGLVDCVSFVCTHQHGIERTFCFKPQFLEHGVTTLKERDSTLSLHP
jgi:hypothetical protein